MSIDRQKSTSSNKVMIYLKGLCLGTIVTAICVLLFSAVMLLLETGNSFAAPFATVCVAAGAFVAALYCARKIGDKGYLTGLIIGLVIFTLVTLVSLIINKQGVSYNTLFHLIIILLASLIGGIVGVNRRKNRKYI